MRTDPGSRTSPDWSGVETGDVLQVLRQQHESAEHRHGDDRHHDHGDDVVAAAEHAQVEQCVVHALQDELTPHEKREEHDASDDRSETTPIESLPPDSPSPPNWLRP